MGLDNSAKDGAVVIFLRLLGNNAFQRCREEGTVVSPNRSVQQETCFVGRLMARECRRQTRYYK